MEEEETEGSGYVYNGWISFHIEMFPLRIFVGCKQPTPSILEQSVANPWRLSMTTDAYNGVSFWQVKAGTDHHKSKMGDASVETSGGNNQTSTKCSE